MPVPDKLRELMYRHHITYPKLASEAGTEESTVRAWAAGNASANIKAAFARLAGRSVEELDAELNGHA